MQIGIDKAVLENHPTMEIGYLVAKVSVKKTDPYVESLKQGLAKHLQEKGIDATNFGVHPSIALWRKIFEEDFQVKIKNYRSSVEALVRRVVTGKEMWNIFNVVDLYNCFSIISLLPMGGYDLKKVTGDITIRYAKEAEPFLGLGESEPIATRANHVVYADDKRVMCWLWNHRDCVDTCIDESSEYVIFFLDSFEHDRMETALEQLGDHLEKIQGTIMETGTLNGASPVVSLKEWVACS